MLLMNDATIFGRRIPWSGRGHPRILPNVGNIFQSLSTQFTLTVQAKTSARLFDIHSAGVLVRKQCEHTFVYLDIG